MFGCFARRAEHLSQCGAGMLRVKYEIFEKPFLLSAISLASRPERRYNEVMCESAMYWRFTMSFPYKISVVVPCYNEEGNVSGLYDETLRVIGGRGISFEMIFVNDGSTDGTMKRLEDIAARADCHVRVVEFSRNFGKEAGIYAGLRNASGEYTVIMDGDMQQSPDVVLEMYDFLESHPETDCVAAVQEQRSEGAVLSFFKRSFYSIINRASSVEFTSGASDFRMMRRPVLEAVLGMSEYYRFSKGLFAFVGFNTHYLPYVARPRGSGKTKWSFWGLVRYAVDGIVGFTTAPLRITTWVGVILSALAFIYLLVVIVKKLIWGDPVPGYPTIVSLILLLGGLQLLAIGVIGEYLGRTYMETKNRPVYIERRVIDGGQNAPLYQPSDDSSEPASQE